MPTSDIVIMPEREIPDIHEISNKGIWSLGSPNTSILLSWAFMEASTTRD